MAQTALMATLRAESDIVAGLSESGGATFVQPCIFPPMIDHFGHRVEGATAPDSENPATGGHPDGCLVRFGAECRNGCPRTMCPLHSSGVWSPDP